MWKKVDFWIDFSGFFRNVDPSFLLVLPSVRKVNCRKTNKRKKKRRKGTVKERKHCCLTLTRLSGCHAEQARGGFFDVDSEGQKIDKNRALDAQGPKKLPRRARKYRVSGIDGPRAASRAVKDLKETREKRHKGTCDWV